MPNTVIYVKSHQNLIPTLTAILVLFQKLRFKPINLEFPVHHYKDNLLKIGGGKVILPEIIFLFFC